MKKSNKSSGSSSIFSRLVPSFLLPPNQVHLPDESDASIVWDEDKKRWVDKNSGGDDEDSMANSAPPSDMDLSRNNSTANFGDQASGPPGGAPAGAGPGAPPPMMMAGGGNKFAGGIGKRRGAQVLNPFKNSQSTPALSSSNSLPPPSELFAPIAPVSVSPAEESAAPAAPTATTPEGGPVFFNPTNFANGQPTTQRNKY